jgi:ATP-dependent Clp protease ATP-binding subunit ClpA
VQSLLVLRTVQVLSRRRKNNPLFVGQAGVGKTAIAQGIAKHIVDGKVPKVKPCKILMVSSTDGSSISIFWNRLDSA